MGYGQGIAVSCGGGRRCGSDLVLLWCRLAAVAPIRPLDWESPYASGCGPKKTQDKKKKKKKKKKKEFPSFWRLNSISLCLNTTFYLSIHLSVGTWVGSTFWPLCTSVANAAMNMSVQVSVWVPAFCSFVYVPRADLLDSVGILVEEFLPVLHSSLTISHFYQLLTDVSVFLHRSNACHFLFWYLI